MEEIIEKIKKISTDVTENEYSNYLEQCHAMLIKLHDLGESKEIVYQTLLEYHNSLEDGISYDFIADILDFVVGWCSPDRCIWDV